MMATQDMELSGFSCHVCQVVWHATHNLFSVCTLLAQGLDLDSGRRQQFVARPATKESCSMRRS